jgi:hypothetical protein
MDEEDRPDPFVLRFGSYEELVQFLRTWRNFADPYMYDFVGMAHLLGACLDNLEENAPEEDLLEDLSDCLTEEQIAFLKKIARVIGH